MDGLGSVVAVLQDQIVALYAAIASGLYLRQRHIVAHIRQIIDDTHVGDSLCSVKAGQSKYSGFLAHDNQCFSGLRHR